MTPPAHPPAPRRDEPVSSSRKWMLLTALCTFLLIVYICIFIYSTNYSRQHLFARFTELGIACFFVLRALFRAVSAAGFCRHQRNFDTLAAALRPQRGAWVATGFLLIVFACVVPVYTYMMKHNSTGLKHFVEIYRAQVKAAEKKAATP